MQNPRKAGLLGWLFRYYVVALVAVCFAIVVASVALYRELTAELPGLAEIEGYEAFAPGVTRIYAAEGTLLAELAREHRAYVRYQDIPEPVVMAFLATEDRRFFEHGGLDYRGLARAVMANLRSGTVVQGGSTITQQVAKGFLSDDRTLARKLREAVLALRIEARLSKQRIAEIYLNKIFLGHNAYGVGAAASRYFAKKLGDLTLAEAALIAGLARAPSRYSPFSSMERARARRAVVLQNMVEAGYITDAERDAAGAEPISLSDPPDVFRLRAPYYAEHVRKLVAAELGADAVLRDGLQIETALEPWPQAWAEEMVDDAVRKLDRRQGWRGPVSHLGGVGARERFVTRQREVYGTDALTNPKRWYLAIVEDVQRYQVTVRIADQVASLPLDNMKWASHYDRNSGVNDLEIRHAEEALVVGDVVWVRIDEKGSEKRRRADETDHTWVVELGQTPRVEAALYTVEHETGYVVAIQGGHDYDRSQFIRPLQACRQPGSVFKAIYYAHALETGLFTMASVLEDVAYQPEPGEEWNPENLHGTLDGKILLRNAFIHSKNLPSIQLFRQLGADEVVRFARRLGFTTEMIADKALSLGASCVHMNELARAFGIFVRGGTWFDPIYLRRIIDKNGKTVVDRRHPYDGALDVAGRLDAMARLATNPPEEVVDPQTSYLITKMMRDSVTAGIGRRAQRVEIPAGGKSGTASGRSRTGTGDTTTDTWFVGFTSRYVTVAWMGDDAYERTMGDDDASYTTATPLWTDYMAKVVENVPHVKVPVWRPPGLVTRVVDLRTGGPPIAGQPPVVLYFKQGTAPVQ